MTTAALGTTRYERLQNRNSITRYLHGARLRHVLGHAAALRERLGRPLDVLEIGCNCGQAYKAMDDAGLVRTYLGIDLNPEAVAMAKARYQDRGNCRFILADATSFLSFPPGIDLVVCMETFEHIPEADVDRIVERVCFRRPRLFIVTVPVEVGPAAWFKFFSAQLMRYDRQSGITWRDAWWSGLYRLDKVPRGPHHRGFDWRRLARVIRDNANLVEVRSLPLAWLPRPFALTVMLVAEPLRMADDL